MILLEDRLSEIRQPCPKHGGGPRAPKGKCNEPDPERACSECGARPVVCNLGLCGPCAFGDEATAGGRW